MSWLLPLVYWVAVVDFGFTALAALVRIVRGPTILDRLVASDVLLTTLLLVACLQMVVSGELLAVPMLIAIAATSTFATIIVARFVRRRAERQELLGQPREAGGEGAADVVASADVAAPGAGGAGGASTGQEETHVG